MQRKFTVDELMSLANIPPVYSECYLTTYSALNYTQEAAWRYVFDYLSEYMDKARGILFMGPCGVGKTHLGVSILNSLISEKNTPCLYRDYRELMNQIRSSYDPASKERTSDILDLVMEIDVLMIDDLGSEKVTSWVLDTLNTILNHRYMYQKTTIITTNYLDSREELFDRLTSEEKSIKELHQFLSNQPKEKDELILANRIGVRLRSRLHEMCKLLMVLGSDYRKVPSHRRHNINNEDIQL